MFDVPGHFEQENTPAVSAWQPLSVAASIPYLKAIGLAVSLISVWAGLCAI